GVTGQERSAMRARSPPRDGPVMASGPRAGTGTPALPVVPGSPGRWAMPRAPAAGRPGAPGRWARPPGPAARPAGAPGGRAAGRPGTPGRWAMPRVPAAGRPGTRGRWAMPRVPAAGRPGTPGRWVMPRVRAADQPGALVRVKAWARLGPRTRAWLARTALP